MKLLANLRSAALTIAAAAALAGCMATGRDLALDDAVQVDPAIAAMYAPVQDGDFVVPAVNLRVIDPQFYRQEVSLPANIPNRPGTIVVDPDNRFLYLVREDGNALRYGIGVGREGFAWHGTATIKSKQESTNWCPPADLG